MKSLFLVFALTCSQLAFSQSVDIHSEESKYMGYLYQQQEYLLDDPAGDIYLLWSARQVPQTIIATLKGKSEEALKARREAIERLRLKTESNPTYDELKNIIINDYKAYREEDYPLELEGHKAPFKTKELANMFKQVIFEEYTLNGIVPSYGSPHEWSPSIKKDLKKEFFLFARYSKILVALARGVTSKFMVTGTENQLLDFIIMQENESITLDQMFRASYRINQGDVYLSFLTIENVLSRFWATPMREKRLVTTKLKDITNYNYKTDKFGSWYHLFGIMFYGYVKGSFSSTLVGNLETGGSLILSKFEKENQETYINSRGGKVGARIKRFIKNSQYKKFKPSDEYTQESYYLRLDEDFSKRIRKTVEKKN